MIKNRTNSFYENAPRSNSDKGKNASKSGRQLMRVQRLLYRATWFPQNGEYFD